MNSYEYIQEVKRIKGLDTDYKAAKLLEWNQHKISNYKSGQSMDNNAARQVAQILNVSVWDIIADMEVMRSKDETTRKAWDKLPRQAGVISLKALLVLPLLIFGGLQYILCKIAELEEKGMIPA